MQIINEPLKEALDVYNNEPCAREFEEDVSYYMKHGYVHCTPDYFVMARPVSLSWTDVQIVDPCGIKCELTGDHDAWHIALMAGDAIEACSHFPYSLPYISFERQNQLRTYDYARFIDHLLKPSRFSL